MGGTQSQESNDNVKQVNNESSSGTHFIEFNLHGPTLTVAAILCFAAVVFLCIAPRCARFLRREWQRDQNRGRHHLEPHPYYRGQLPSVYYRPTPYDVDRFEDLGALPLQPRHHGLTTPAAKFMVESETPPSAQDRRTEEEKSLGLTSRQ